MAGAESGVRFCVLEKVAKINTREKKKDGAKIKLAKFKGRYTLGDKSLQHVAATRRCDKSLRVYWRIFVKIFFAATGFCRRN